MPDKRPAQPVQLIRTSVFLTQKQHDALAAIYQETRIPQAVLIRMGVDLVLERYKPAASRPGGKR